MDHRFVLDHIVFCFSFWEITDSSAFDKLGITVAALTFVKSRAEIFRYLLFDLDLVNCTLREQFIQLII